jgi:hypothetical protein
MAATARAAGAPVSPTGLAFRLLLVLLYGSGVAGIVYFLSQGAGYYLTPIAERARHPDYWALKPGGTLGLRFGIAGLTLMTLMHLYSVRKRVRRLRRAGRLRAWLDIHILMGIFGPLLVVLHSSFKIGGLIAISFWAMVAVALSGVFGRWLYLQIPRTRAGDEIGLAEIEAADRALSERLRSRFGVEAAFLERLDALATRGLERRGLLAVLVRLSLHDVSPLRRHRLRALARSVPGIPAPVADELAGVLAQKVAGRRRILLWDALHRLFHHWHVVHKPFAIVMYLFVLVHVIVATMTGYGLQWR